MPRLHPQLQYQLKYIGRERQPLLVVDQLFENAESLIDFAESSYPLQMDKKFYPGVRAPVPSIYNEIILRELGPLFCEVFKVVGQDIAKMESHFSIVSKRPEELQSVQRIPHFDLPRMNELAILSLFEFALW